MKKKIKLMKTKYANLHKEREKEIERVKKLNEKLINFVKDENNRKRIRI